MRVCRYSVNFLLNFWTWTSTNGLSRDNRLKGDKVHWLSNIFDDDSTISKSLYELHLEDNHLNRLKIGPFFRNVSFHRLSLLALQPNEFTPEQVVCR